MQKKAVNKTKKSKGLSDAALIQKYETNKSFDLDKTIKRLAKTQKK